MLLRMTKIVQSAKQPMLNLPTKIQNDVITKVATKIGKYKHIGIEFKRLGKWGKGQLRSFAKGTCQKDD